MTFKIRYPRNSKRLLYVAILDSGENLLIISYSRLLETTISVRSSSLSPHIYPKFRCSRFHHVYKPSGTTIELFTQIWMFSLPVAIAKLYRLLNCDSFRNSFSLRVASTTQAIALAVVQ